MDEVPAGRDATHGAGHRDDEQRREPGPSADVADEAAAVREPEVPVAARREDGNVDVPRERAHEIGDEAAREIALVARIGGREVDDAERLDVVEGRRRADGRETGFHRDTHRQPDVDA